MLGEMNLKSKTSVKMSVITLQSVLKFASQALLIAQTFVD
jgi:hypothetical protein